MASVGYWQHESAIIDEGATIGEVTKIWHFSHVCAGAVIGASCSLDQNIFVGNRVMIGNNCKIQNNVSVYDNVTLEDDVFLVQAWFSPTSTSREQQSPARMSIAIHSSVKVQSSEPTVRLFAG